MTERERKRDREGEGERERGGERERERERERKKDRERERAASCQNSADLSVHLFNAALSISLFICLSLRSFRQRAQGSRNSCGGLRASARRRERIKTRQIVREIWRKKREQRDDEEERL